MKVCGLKWHRTYREDFSRFAVFLDGTIVRDCVYADDTVGRVIHLVHDPVQNVIKTNAAGTGPELAEQYGAVVIRRSSLPLTDRYTDAFLDLFSKNKTPIIRPH